MLIVHSHVKCQRVSKHFLCTTPASPWSPGEDFFSKAIGLAQTADCTLRWFKPGLAAHPTHLVDKQTPRFSVNRPWLTSLIQLVLIRDITYIIHLLRKWDEPPSSDVVLYEHRLRHNHMVTTFPIQLGINWVSPILQVPQRSYCW